MAALILTEAQCENADSKETSYIATLDAQKAFDVVFQDSLLRRIFLLGGRTHCNYYAASIRGTKLRVRLDGNLSREVCVRQGVGQGRVPSTGYYKVFIDPVLQSLSEARDGQYIGPYYCGCPTCADDIVLLATSSEDLQLQLDIVYAFSTRERYKIHPQKSKVMVVQGNRRQPVLDQWFLGNEPLEVADNCTHLGLERSSNQLTPDSMITDRIQLARRTAYSLTGAGFHGSNGISPAVCRRMIILYILPRLLFGLEATIVSSKQVNKLEIYLRQLLRQLQNLPDRAANSATLLLIGIPPV